MWLGQLWAKLVQAEALMLQTLLSVSSSANEDTLAACVAVTAALELALPTSQNRTALREEISEKLFITAEEERKLAMGQAKDGKETGNLGDLEGGHQKCTTGRPTLAHQALLIDLEVQLVKVAMHLMAGHMMKAAATIRKVIKHSHWLLKATDLDSKTSKKGPMEGVGGVKMFQNLFFGKKGPTPTSAPGPTPPAANSSINPNPKNGSGGVPSTSCVGVPGKGGEGE
ncbi:unnamed protein product, partial [Choristocarpus tenellus]